MKFLTNKYFLFFLRFLLGIVFIFAGIEKINSPNSFFNSINNYKIFSDYISYSIVLILPWLELFIGILLIFNKYIKECLTIYMILLILFNILVFSAIIRGLNIDCGCYGNSINVKASYTKIAENFGLFFIALYLFLYYKNITMNE
ncbi:MAG TPA: MauE/DoxX family redox-associated membrane protein [Melioribacteraceae bacterium]|nr:MauE/DoxX family redox-associated membrane protein [Melioribacteraceae bacterium]